MLGKRRRDEDTVNDADDLPPGLSLVLDAITPEQETELLRRIDAEPWNDAPMRRRVQQYGWRYDYRQRTVQPSDHIGPLPAWMKPAVDQLSFEPQQCIVNEYLPGQGIGAHIDQPQAFGPVVASLSLGHAVYMEFRRAGRVVEILLPRRSMLIITGDARYRWTHAIAARRSDQGVPRKRRASMTFRTTKSSAAKAHG